MRISLWVDGDSPHPSGLNWFGRKWDCFLQRTAIVLPGEITQWICLFTRRIQNLNFDASRFSKTDRTRHLHPPYKKATVYGRFLYLFPPLPFPHCLSPFPSSPPLTCQRANVPTCNAPFLQPRLCANAVPPHAHHNRAALVRPVNPNALVPVPGHDLWRRMPVPVVCTA